MALIQVIKTAWFLAQQANHFLISKLLQPNGKKHSFATVVPAGIAGAGEFKLTLP
jgi:hypothetical protein